MARINGVEGGPDDGPLHLRVMIIGPDGKAPIGELLKQKATGETSQEQRPVEASGVISWQSQSGAVKYLGLGVGVYLGPRIL